MILDTNILIYYLNGDLKVIDTVNSWRVRGVALFVSSISVMEVLSLAALTLHDEEKIRNFLRPFIPIVFDNDIAEIGALLRRKYGLKATDAGIAATALHRGIPLISRDQQFKRVQELKVIEI